LERRITLPLIRRLSRGQSGCPTEIVVRTDRFHHDRRRQYEDDLQQRAGRENPSYQSHVMLPWAVIYGTGAALSAAAGLFQRGT
jgi:hypothetical protein